MNTGWQNFVGNMLVSFEDKFGPIDKAMLGIWNRAEAEAKIFWLEVTTNGPAVFHNLTSNIEAEFSTLPGLWDSALDVMWEGVENFGRKFTLFWDSHFWAKKAAEVSLKFEGKFDQATFDKAVDAMEHPAREKFLKKLEAGQKKWDAVKLDENSIAEEKWNILDAAAMQTEADSKNLDAKAKLGKQTSDYIEDGFSRGAAILLDAVKESDALASGSYEAFKLLYRSPSTGATVGVAAYAGALGGGMSGSGGGISELLASNAQVVDALNNLLNLKRDSNRDLTKIRDGVQAIGVA